MGIRAAAVMMSIVFPVTALAASPPSGGASVSSPAKACYNIRGSVKIPAAPRGFANLVTTRLTSDCRLLVSGVVMVPQQSPLLTTSPDLLGDAEKSAATASANLAQPAASSAADPVATSHYRLWDLAGIKLNATATVATWTDNGVAITGGSGALHLYYYNDGWYVYSQWIGWIGGGVGLTYATLQGEGIFCYPPNCTFYNSDDNYITVNGNGTYSNCYSTWYWKVGFPGWHTQVWCESGYSGV
jgi:hypothetical protein